MTEVEGFFQELKEMADKATPEQKERGRILTQRFANSRLTYKDRKK